MKYDFTQKRLMQARNYIIKFLFCSSISFSDACIKVNIIWIFRWTIKAYLFGFTLAPVALWLALGRLLQNLPDQFDLTPLLVSVRHPGISTDLLSHQRRKGTIRKDMESEFWNSINMNSLNLITCYILICQITVLFKCNWHFRFKALYPAVVEYCRCSHYKIAYHSPDHLLFLKGTNLYKLYPMTSKPTHGNPSKLKNGNLPYLKLTDNS